MKTRLDQQFNFIKEIDQEKNIKRQTLKNDYTFENDSEHAWHMAIMAILLSEYANEEIDVLKTVTMLLIHDIVEIDAGDTYAYDEKGKETQTQREALAASRIFGLLPKDQGDKLKALFEEFEANETPEARFAHSMDNIQPVMLNDATNGEMWQRKGIHVNQVLKRNEITSLGSQELWQYAYEHFIEPNVKKGKLKS